MANRPRVSMNDIARMARVSPDQVRKVMLGHPDVLPDVRSRVLQVMEMTGADSTPGQQRETAGTIGIVLPVPMLSDYIGDVARGILETAESRGYAYMINVQGPDRRDDMLDLVGEHGCDGMVLVVPHHYDELVALCHDYQRPYVLVDYHGDPETVDAPSVEVDNYAGMMQVMNHLFGFRHVRIGFITGRMIHASARLRLEAYQQALSGAGIPYDPELVVEGDWTHPTSYEAARKLLRLPNRPTAIAASNDLSAFGAIQAAGEMGLQIGRQLSVTGFDDIDMAATISTPLTTISQPAHTMGQVAAEMLIQQFQGQPVEDPHRKLAVRLMVRQSTGPAQR